MYLIAISIKFMKLNSRLNEIYKLIPDTTIRLVDVGCDHALLTKKFLQNNALAEALLIDVNEGPLEKAASNLTDIDENRYELSLSDGLEDWEIQENDCIVIAGMGAKEILSILNSKLMQIKNFENPDTYNKEVDLIIQAMRNQENTRHLFKENNIEMIEQSLVKDKNFTYSIDRYRFKFSEISKLIEMMSIFDLDSYLGEVLYESLLNKSTKKLNFKNQTVIENYLARQANIIRSDLDAYSGEEKSKRYKLIEAIESLQKYESKRRII